MKMEIERKFLTRSDAWRSEDKRVFIRQGYLRADAGGSIRIRIVNEQAILTLKGPSSGISRSEMEYTIPRSDADNLLSELSLGRTVEKWRTCVQYAGHTWEVDEFLGENQGLVVAEIELEEEEELFEAPPWLGPEVSNDPRFFNASLALHPYSEWENT
jgi:adenylate cyclase